MIIVFISRPIFGLAGLVDAFFGHFGLTVVLLGASRRVVALLPCFSGVCSIPLGTEVQRAFVL